MLPLNKNTSYFQVCLRTRKIYSNFLSLVWHLGPDALAKSLCMLIKQLFIRYIEQYTCTYLQDAIEKLMASGNVDNPEGGLEALVQVAACEKVGQ